MHRRNFMASAALALPGLMTSDLFAGTYPTFDEFKRDPQTLGQRYLDGLVERDISPEARRIVTDFLFDTDTSKCRYNVDKHFEIRMPDAFMEKYLNDITSSRESIISTANTFLTKEVEGMSDDDILAFFKKPETRQMLVAGIRRYIVDNECQANNGINIQNDLVSRTSTVIVDRNAADGGEYDLRWFIFGRRVSYPASELKLRGTLHHEVFHAFDIYYGVNINGKRVRLYDTSLSPYVIGAIHEARARAFHLGFLRGYNKKYGRPSQKYTHEYVAMCTTMDASMENLKTEQRTSKNDIERAILDIQIKEFEPFASEAVAVLGEVITELIPEAGTR